MHTCTISLERHHGLSTFALAHFLHLLDCLTHRLRWCLDLDAVDVAVWTRVVQVICLLFLFQPGDVFIFVSLMLGSQTCQSFFVRVESKPALQPRPTITGRQPPEAAKLNNLIWRKKKKTFSSFTWLRLRCFLAYLIERHAPTLIVCWI